MADITTGYSFVSGEKNVTHTKLNAQVNSAVINTSFHTGKSAAGSNPTPASTELMIYDSAAGSFKKGTLSSLVFDHTGLLSARTAKTAPVAADAVLISDSAAGGALKQATVSNLLFGAAAHPNPAAAPDRLAIFDSVDSSVRSITLSALLASSTNLGTVDGAERALVMTFSGNLRSLQLRDMWSAGAFTALTGAELFSVLSGTTMVKVDIAKLVNKQTAITSPSGAEEILLSVSTAAANKLTLANLKTYISGGIPKAYVLAREEQVSGTDGGTFTSGAWQTRTLNVESVDSAAIASLASNKVSLPAGTYRFRASAPGRSVNGHQVKLYNTTDAADVALGTTELAGSGSAVTTRSFCEGRFTIAAGKDFEVRHRCTSTKATDGFGAAAGIGTEVYAEVEFWKEEV